LINSGFNAGTLKGEISNLTVTKKEQSNVLVSLENSLNGLRRRKAEVLTNYNFLFSQSKDSHIPEAYKKNIASKIAEIKNALSSINLQISSTEKRIHDITETKQKISRVIVARKGLLSNIAGKMMVGSRAQSSLQINKELGRIKG
jgi:hypothetical protein